VKRSLVAAAGALRRLPQRLPYNVAMELALTGDPLTAERAYDLGLVNRLAEPGEALPAALELAATVARNGPLALDATKATLQGQFEGGGGEFGERRGGRGGPVMAWGEGGGGAIAFSENREPVWQGR